MVSMEELQRKFKAVYAEIHRSVIGQDDVIEQMMTSILCNGHAYVEGYPGLAKTLLVKTVADIMDLRFSRIQGTPDLLPSDITGTYVIDESHGKKEFKFQPGPIFANVVLVDEVNRATAKTHSAILEAMQERQVTVGNATYKLEEPFFVLATSNPIEQEGSLTLDQDVFINGELKNGNQLLDFVQKNDIMKIEQGDFNLYKLNGNYTYSLNSFGKLERSECYLYTLPYNNEVINLKTRVGREIKVTKNHPFLINDGGEIKWKKAEELIEGDYLVSISKIEDDSSMFEVMPHLETLKELNKTYKIVYYEDFLELNKISNEFTDFTKFNGKNFDTLRIISKLEIKELANKLNLQNKNEYWQLTRFLRRPTNNITLHNLLSNYFLINKPKIQEETDFIDSLRPISIKRFSMDKDIAFFLAFLMSDGGTSGAIYACQKNYPKALDRFVQILNNKIGVGYSCLIKDETGCRSVSKTSKPFVEYIIIRFGLPKVNHNVAPLPSWFMKLPTDLRKEFLKTFISLEGCIRDNKIKFSQVNKETINVLSYMLLKEGIISWFSKKTRGDYVIKIQGEDFINYLIKIGWIDSEINTEWLSKSKEVKFSPFRVIPAPREQILKLVDLLGINSFHTYKNRRDFVSRNWYCGYKSVKEGRKNISLEMFKLMLNELEKEIKIRENINLDLSKPQDARHMAILCGLSIEEIGNNIGCSFSKIWDYYETGVSNNSSQIQICIKEQFSLRLTQAKSILNYLKKLVPDGVIYDKIEKMSYEPYNDLVFGLTVPGLQNYVAGYGGCGINHNTFRLSEAQLDRFLFKINIGYPKFEEELKIVDIYTERSVDDIKLKKLFTKDELLKLQMLTRQVPVANDMKKYAVQIVTDTRNKKDLIEYGASPRASINLILAAKARALMNGRKYVSKEDIQAMAYPVLRHRIILSFEAERQGISEDEAIKQIFKK